MCLYSGPDCHSVSSIFYDTYRALAHSIASVGYLRSAKVQDSESLNGDLWLGPSINA
jgi:hypothetical protein